MQIVLTLLTVVECFMCIQVGATRANDLILLLKLDRLRLLVCMDCS